MSWSFNSQEFEEGIYQPPRPIPATSVLSNTNNTDDNGHVNDNNNIDNISYGIHSPYYKDDVTERIHYPVRPDSRGSYPQDYFRGPQTSRYGGLGFAGAWTQDGHLQDPRGQEWMERGGPISTSVSVWPSNQQISQQNYQPSNLIVETHPDSNHFRPRSRTPNLVVDISIDRPQSRMSTRSKSRYSTSVADPNGLHIPDRELAGLSVKELNKRVQNHSRDEIRKIKERRRTLKNRGYAANCRLRRHETREKLQERVDELEEQVRKKIRERDYYKWKYEKLQAEKDQKEAQALVVSSQSSNIGQSSLSMLISSSLNSFSNFPLEAHLSQPQTNHQGDNRHRNHQTLHLDLSITGRTSRRAPSPEMEER